MGRVQPSKGGNHPGAKGATRAARLAKDRRKQKVVLESVSQEKSKLRSVITFRADPPAGYTFIPAGNPELTNALKEFARKGDYKVFSVSTTPHPTRHELSREVHRVGFHFPTEVVSQVCSHYGIRLTSGGQLIKDTKDNDQLFMKVYQKGQLVLNEKVQDQVTINTDAKQIIKDLFPNIPDKDLFQIIKTAFQLGDHKVGTADEIPLVRRAQLSVVAHVRHIYTDYDKLLKRVPYNEARHRVEKDTLSRLVEWRGDDDKDNEAGRRAVDDVFREVIVISDEEDSDDDIEDGEQIGHEDLRVEELPSNAYAPLVRRPLSPVEVIPIDEAPAGFRFVPQVVRRYRPATEDISMRDRSRYAIWDQARQDYRSSISRPVPALERVYLPDSEVSSSRLVPFDEPQYTSRDVPYSNTVQRPPEYEVRPIRQPSPPSYIRGNDGSLYERVITRSNDKQITSFGPSQRQTPPASQRSHPSSRPITPPPFRPLNGNRRIVSFGGGDESVLPSIEGPNGGLISPTIRRNPYENTQSDPNHRYRGNADYEDSWPRRDIYPIKLPDAFQQPSKRRRVEDQPRAFVSPIGQEHDRVDPFCTVDHTYRSSTLAVPSFPERRIIDVDDRYVPPGPDYKLSQPDPLLSPKTRPGFNARDVYGLGGAPQRSVSDLLYVREPKISESQRTSFYTHRDFDAPSNSSINGAKRVVLADDDFGGVIEKHIVYTEPSRRIVYEDHRPIEPLARFEHTQQSFPEQGNTRRTYVQEPSRRILEPIPVDREVLPSYRPQAEREYIPFSESGRQPIHVSHIHSDSYQTTHSPQRSGIGQRMVPPEGIVDRRYNHMSRKTYVQQ